VKLPRELRLGSIGRDVRALQRALIKAKIRNPKRKVTNVFDSDTVRDVRNFQRTHGLHVDGEVRKDTFAALERFYDRFGRSLVAMVKANPSPSTVRQRIVSAAQLAARNRDKIDYTQNTKPQNGPVRMEGVLQKIHPPRFPRHEDCSSFVTWCYFAAGAPDPNGKGYNGTGFTGDEVLQGREVRMPRPGDLVFYGHSHDAITHVTLYIGNGRVVSHGQKSGPTIYGIDYNRGKLGGRQQIRTYLP
jgi:hypothetical protein